MTDEAPHLPPPDEAQASSSLRVLVVEDNPSERWLIGEMVRARGHVVTACEDAESGLQAMEDQVFPLVLLDWSLPGMDGLDLCRRIRNSHWDLEPVIVMITGHDDPALLEKALDAGVDDYIAKPVDVNRLRVRMALAERAVAASRRREATDRALDQAHEELATLFTNLDEVVFSIDLEEQRLIQISPAAVEVLGVDPKILLSRDELWPEFLYPNGWVAIEAELKALPQGQPFTAEFEIRRPDRDARFVEARYHVQRDENGRAVRLDGVLTDRTQAVTTRRELARRNEELSTLYRAAELTQQSESVAQACRDVLRELLRVTDGDAAWVAVADPDRAVLHMLAAHGGDEGWTPPTEIPLADTLEETVLRTGNRARVDEVRRRSEARAELYHDLGSRELLIFPLGPSSEPFGTLTVSRSAGEGMSDRTAEVARGVAGHLSVFLGRMRAEGAIEETEADYKALAAQLQAANDELQAFTYTVSHDLRAPLRTMQGFAHALIRQSSDSLDDQSKDYAGRIISSGESLEALINDLLQYSRLAFEELELQVVELSDVVKEARAQVLADLEERAAVVKVDSRLPQAVGNHRTLVQVVSNLLSNASKFVPRDRTPEIVVSGERVDGWVRLSISDNGVGIPPDQQERIFRTFERGRENQDRQGTGIGLAIVRKGMERVGGTVSLESRPGEGTTFHLKLPRKAARKGWRPWRGRGSEEGEE